MVAIVAWKLSAMAHFEIPDDLAADWPDVWRASTHIDCGYQAGLYTNVAVIGGYPSPGHVANFRLLLARWDSLWAEFLHHLSHQLKCKHELGFPQTTLGLLLPSQSIEEGGEWQIVFRIRGKPGYWTLCYGGWELDAGKEKSNYCWKD